MRAGGRSGGTRNPMVVAPIRYQERRSERCGGVWHRRSLLRRSSAPDPAGSGKRSGFPARLQAANTRLESEPRAASAHLGSTSGSRSGRDRWRQKRFWAQGGGDSLRPGCQHDASDAAQLAELKNPWLTHPPGLETRCAGDGGGSGPRANGSD